MENNMDDFSQFKLDIRIKRAISDLEWLKPTDIQKEGLQHALNGYHILIRSKTGSGKTGIYLIAILEKLLMCKKNKEHVRALILAPSVELSQQIYDFTKDLTKYIQHIRFINACSSRHTRPGSFDEFDIIIGTPSRCLELLQNGILTDTSQIKITVFDEADLLFSFGHDKSLDSIASLLPTRLQSYVLSATLNENVENLCSINLYNPKRIVSSNEPFPDSCQLSQYLIKCEMEDKYLILYSLISLKLIKGKIIIFTDTIVHSYKLMLFLKSFSIPCLVLNPELPENSRLKKIDSFKSNKAQILISTDDVNTKDDGDSRHFSASRGIDFINVETVINFNFPPTISSYIHRVGRTARANSVGIAFTLFTYENPELLVSLQSFIDKNSDSKLLPFKFRMDFVEGFRYRVEDSIKSITKSAITNERRTEIKQEIYGSQKFQDHFKKNPHDKLILKSNGISKKNKIAQHTDKLPDYLIPQSLKTSYNVELEKTESFNFNRKKLFMEKKFAKKKLSHDPMRCGKSKRNNLVM
ncbi:hypothetical protein HZS_7036 [Henneguya salminicola]|nr:hypothetical protein HZS_7036 [Henneguya salminicola]